MPVEKKKGSSEGPGLKARAAAFLARREHSRHELARKLSAHGEPDEIQTVLDELQRDGWQSDARFAQAFVSSRQARFGVRRLIHDLAEHRIDESILADLRADLLESEASRAQDVWQRKFGKLPANARDYARQYRFMAQRGFSSEVLRRLLGGRYNNE